MTLDHDSSERDASAEHGGTPRPVLATRMAALSFVVSVLGAIGFVVAYTTLHDSGWQTQALGLGLMVACGGLGAGLVVWAQGAMPLGPHVQDRDEARIGSSEIAHDVRRKLRSDTDQIGRRSLLSRLLGAALGALGLSALVPLASLGPARAEAPDGDPPTGWGPGRRLLARNGAPVRPGDVPLGGAISVTPEGTEPSAANQAMLIRLAEDGQVDVGTGRTAWTAAGHVAYSRLCTHMACAVGLYQVESKSLVCPCHQSAFQVEDGGRPQFGPATRPLPQLPLGVDDAGFLVAVDDFDRPVGTATWDHPQRVEELGS